MAVDASDALVQALHSHNSWWENGTEAFSLPSREKSDFYNLVRPGEPDSQFEDQRLLGLVGRQGVGKTTLLHQFVHRCIETGSAPERFLYLPFDANPLYQLKSDRQLRRAVRYYESRILGRIDPDGPQFLLLDDVHQIDHPNKPTVDRWGVPVAELLEEAPDRYVAVTATAGTQVRRELEDVETPGEYTIQPILPEKFRDHIFTVYPEFENGETRTSPTSLRSGEHSLPAALRSGDVTPLVSELNRKYDNVANVARRIQSQVVDYLAMGGTISYERDDVVESAAALTTEDYTRLREDVRNGLYRDVPGFESIQTIADLERLCALAARNRGSEAIRYQELVDLFDVDRRTIADSYLPTLSALYLLTGITEYDNSRPRSVKLFLRDTGLVTALTDGDPTAVRNDFEMEADLARVAAFDHTMRFAYGLNAAQGEERPPSVEYWRGREGELNYVFEVGDTPVPIGMAYQSRERDGSLAALREFRGSYDTPLGLLLTSDTVREGRPVEHLGDGIVQLPYWLYLLLC
jgi:predicted AAA+ superfamily ATPase